MTGPTETAPCTDAWDPAYDEEFARSGVTRDLLGKRYESSVRPA